MDIKKSEASAEGFYASTQIVSGYLTDRWNNLINPVLLKHETPNRDACIKSLYLRATAWLKTLTKMDHAVCAQATLAGYRSLIEIVVDLFLLHHDKTNGSGWKVYVWGLSEKLKGAEETLEYYSKNGIPLPEQFEPRRDFIKCEKVNIDNLRKILWPAKDPNKAVHPNRWTERKLADDIKVVDSFYGAIIKDDLGVTLEELYCTQFRYLSWFVHSGTASVFDLPAEHYNLICGLSFKGSADLGMLCAKIVLTDFGLTDHLTGLKDEWARLSELRTKSFFDTQMQRLGEL